jgi:predicted anti-sigma-YlaC factor YlaD
VRRGAALPSVLLTVALTSALAVGSVYVSRQLIAGARLTTGALQLQPELESALANAMATWDSSARASQPIGSTVALADAWVTRLAENLYLIVAEASRARAPVLRRRSGVLTTTYGGAARPVPDRAFFELP